MATKRQEGGPQADPEVDEDEEDAIEESIEVAGVPLVVWVVRLTLILFIQGLMVLGSYAYYGFGTDAAHFGPGFRLDPIHAAARYSAPSDWRGAVAPPPIPAQYRAQARAPAPSAGSAGEDRPA